MTDRDFIRIATSHHIVPDNRMLECFREIVEYSNGDTRQVQVAPTQGADARPAVSDLQAFADTARNGIADYIADNMADRKHSLDEIDTYIRAIEINADRLATRDAAPAPDVWTVIAPDGRKWQGPSIARTALRARFESGDSKEMLNNIQAALTDIPDTEPGQCVHCGYVEAARATAEQSTDEAAEKKLTVVLAVTVMRLMRHLPKGDPEFDKAMKLLNDNGFIKTYTLSEKS